MPTLQRRVDGSYYLRHFYRDHNTWQILGAGVRYLERRGIREGDRFATDMFIELWLRQLVYHGDKIPIPIDEALRDTALEASVRARVKNFHQLLYPGRASDAVSFLLNAEPCLVAKFCEDAILYCGARWKIADILLYGVPPERRGEFQEARRFAVVALRITVGDEPTREIAEYWLEVTDEWYVLWE